MGRSRPSRAELALAGHSASRFPPETGRSVTLPLQPWSPTLGESHLLDMEAQEEIKTKFEGTAQAQRETEGKGRGVRRLGMRLGEEEPCVIQAGKTEQVSTSQGS